MVNLKEVFTNMLDQKPKVCFIRGKKELKMKTPFFDQNRDLTIKELKTFFS